MDKDLTGLDEKSSKTLPGAVEKIIKSHDLAESEKAQIVIEGAEELYREVRISNTLKDANGKEVALKEGANVDITISADAKNTIKKLE